MDNAVMRKRKRVNTGSSTGDLPAVRTDEPNRMPAATTSSTSKRTSKVKLKEKPNPSPTPPISTSSWPLAFCLLSQVHATLNLVYTFCCTRKHMATTFDTLRAAVEPQMRRALTVDDVARIRALVPRAVRFEVVDGGLLDVMAAREMGGKGRVWEGLEEEMKIYKGEGVSHDGDEEGDGQVLLFEFVDGDLKTEKRAGSGARKKTDDMRMPVFSQKQMIELIEKRNRKFAEAVESFLSRCCESGADPVEQLEMAKEQYMPRLGPKRPEVPKEIPKERKSMTDIITDIKQADWYNGQIVPNGHRVFEAREPVYGDLKFPLSQNLVNALYNSRGITRFYSHQAEAINNVHDGFNVVISTATSSGKSLIYQLPMLHALEEDIHSRGIYIFPTKALAQDQRRSMQDLLRYMPGLEDVIVETFDGDTPLEVRDAIRDHARIVFVNPDILHLTILPQESRWRTFLQNLKFVVVDELHVYNGLFGAHVAMVMRRLRRLCAAVGNPGVRFISCSATVANPVEHMKTIFGVTQVRLTDVDGSPAGRKEYLCWNTPFRDPSDPTSGRGSSFDETARLFCHLVLQGARVIAFCRIRKQCEFLLSCVRQEFRAHDRADAARLVMGYRGGYSPQDRRQIEADMFSGQLLGIVATSALELGIDIGALDAVLTHGFPWSVAALRQQSGRAGRRNRDALAVLVGDAFALDQHYMHNPDELFAADNAMLQVDLTNELVLEPHLQCAAFELPVHPALDAVYFGERVDAISQAALVLDANDDELFHCKQQLLPQPSRHVAIRDIEAVKYAVVDTTGNRNVVLEEIDEGNVFFSLYEGGIHLYQGNSYLVKEVNVDRHLARVVRVHVDWTTRQRDFTDVDPQKTLDSCPLGENAASDSSNTSEQPPSSSWVSKSAPNEHPCAFFGTIRISTLVYGFFKFDRANRVLDAVELDNPPLIRYRPGLWLDIPPRAINILAARNLNAAAAIHSAEHALLKLLSACAVLAGPGEMGTECKSPEKELKQTVRQAQPDSAARVVENGGNKKDVRLPRHVVSRIRPARLTLYDTRASTSTITSYYSSLTNGPNPNAIPTGTGLSRAAFERIRPLIYRALARLRACPCTNPRGCAGCVADERCREGNIVMSKAGAGVVLACLAREVVDVGALPVGETLDPDETGPRGEPKELAGGVVTIREVGVGRGG